MIRRVLVLLILGGVTTLVVKSIPDIARYIKISRM
jgi:hypothetical protein